MVDFGIAKALNAQSLTIPGTVKGSFSHMTPEVNCGVTVASEAAAFVGPQTQDGAAEECATRLNAQPTSCELDRAIRRAP